MAEGRQLSEALAKPHAVEALLALLRDGEHGFTSLGEAMGGNIGSGRPMAEHLERYGLVQVEELDVSFPRKQYRVTLTQRGEAVATGLREVVREAFADQQ